MVHKFLIQLQDQEGTRWLVNPQRIQDRLTTLTWLLLPSVTLGPKPSVLVIHEERDTSSEEDQSFDPHA